MTKFEQLLKDLNDLKIMQTEMEWTENLPDGFFAERIGENYKHIARNLEPDKHRWYETSVTVIEIFGKFLGIRHISDLSSESSSVDDICRTLDFFEMKPVQITTYVTA